MEIPSLFDEANDLIKALEEQGTNLSSEKGQFRQLTAQFKKKRAAFIRKIGGPRGMQQARQSRQPSQDHPWWFADKELAAENRQKTIRLLRYFGIAAVLLTAAVLIYNQFFAPDPAFQASYGHQQRAENALLEGDLEAALSEVQQALEYTPESPELYVLEGIILEALGENEAANASYENARRLYEQEAYFYNQRTLLYLMLGDPQRALEDSQTAIQIEPDSAISYLHQGQAYEAMGEIIKAIESYEKADEIAQQSGNPQLQAIIRVTLSNAYQLISLPTLESTAPRPTTDP
jgi:tetratricopeptide (TPR) repeat protein